MSRTATTASWTCWTVGRDDREHLREAIQRHRWWSFPRRWGISLGIWVESTTAVKSRKRNKLLWMNCHYSRMCEVRAMSSTEPSTFCSLRCVIFIPEKSLLLITMDWNIIIQRIISYNRCLFLMIATRFPHVYQVIGVWREHFYWLGWLYDPVCTTAWIDIR